MPPFSVRRLLSWRILVRSACWLMLGYGVVVAVLLACEDRLVFHPLSASQRWDELPSGLAVQDIVLAESGSRIHARWFPCVGALKAVLYCHGRGGNLSRELHAVEIAAWQREIGCSLLIFDYPGYGRSTGSPSESGCYAAAAVAYRWLNRTQGVMPRQILICGRSLGTAVAVELASQRPHRALILVCPFTSLPDVAISYFPLLPARQLMSNRFDSLARIGRCKQPVFIVHGTRDHVVPLAQGKALFAAANQPKQFLTVVGGRHGNCVSPAFFAALRQFLGHEQKHCLAMSGGPRSPLLPCADLAGAPAGG